jgi:hypothetical protein
LDGPITVSLSTSWPQKNAKLFIGAGPPKNFSRIGWGDASHQYVLYKTGYKTSADTLVDYLLVSKSVEKLDTFIFSILFLYRQFVELELKWIILRRSDVDRSKKIAILHDKKAHNLRWLWRKARPVIEKDATLDEQKDVSIVEDYIEQFHVLDETSFSFRYPITKDLDGILNKERRINLPNLRQRMDELYHFFMGLDAKLSSTRDNGQDMEEYFIEMSSG